MWPFTKKKPIVTNTKKKVTDPKLYSKIVLSLSKNLDLKFLTSYDWEIYDLGNHFYKIEGNHPLLSRIDFNDYFFIKH